VKECRPFVWVHTGIPAILLLLASEAALFGQTPPANDDFANAATITGNSALAVGTNSYATKEPGEPNHAGVPGGKSVWWNLQAPGSGYVTISTLGSVSSQFGAPLDTVLAVYIGNSVSNLVEVASNDDGPVDATSELMFKANAGSLYRIAVDGFAMSTNDEADSGFIRLSLMFSLTAPEAPSWGPLPSIGGDPLTSYEFAGKVVVLNFWATTCGGCLTEMPDLSRLQDRYGPAGLAVVGMSIDESPDGSNPPLDLVRSVAQANHVSYPVAMSNPDGSGIEDAFGGIPFLPRTFVIDRDNHIFQTLAGVQSFDTFRTAVLPLVYGPPQVSVTVTNGKLRFAWQVNELTYQVEQTDQLTSGVWTAVQGTLQSDGRHWFLDVSPQPGAQFFRLHRKA
jgi:thiol-disulfide isomerase/thioredoxin